MPEAIRKVNVIGHLNPDTDSICSAIAYAYFKNKTGDTTIYEARRAGAVNRETAFALKHFGFSEPPLITSVTPQIKDTEVQKQAGIDAETSLFEAWNVMRDSKCDTLSITDGDDNLLGLIATKDIANANLDIFDIEVLGNSKTKFANIVSTLNGEMVLGDPEARVEAGSLRVGTTPEMMEDTVKAGDLVLVTNRYETQQFAVGAGASCIVVCCGAHVSAQVKESAESRGCTIIATPYDTYAAARLICMSIPVRAKMIPEKATIKFSVNTAVDDAKKTIASSRHRFFPVIDENGKYVGLVNTPSLLSAKKKHVILVDHNERSQAVEGLEQAEIMEIIDHHRIGSIETEAPALFRNMPVGCTSTIIYQMYQEAGLEIPRDIAGLMLSAIMSDTLAFRSPTCTSMDVNAGEALAKICGEDIPSYSDAMFEAGADLTGRSADEVFHQDFKVFSRGNVKFGVGQGSFMTENSRKAAEKLVGPYLKEAAANEELPMVFYMFTDVKSSTTELLYFGEGAEDVIHRAWGVDVKDGMAVLPGVVSRKKQMVPPLMATFQKIQEEQD
ncbi:MAG: putative manganese-dependent inorganic diphosphatase [Atopobiaceae bacterium]|uniref:putative manganese-dependent inorganic diphosphatase n=1 Tax=Atopobiaceae TaxID=1643824 RepID=UPI000D79944B|nr:putative manganese-dependent inorganic diphosphatase [Atopobiaceae bacterium]PWM29747.1 MAG: putative manganese-dependent inorganic diphosphatase [Coriobacteriia bacterium]